MANEKYTHTRGHEPLRIPQGWREQERAFVIQLERILTDVYQRFGKIGVGDLSKELQVFLEDIDRKCDDLSKIYGMTVTELKNKGSD